MYFNLLLQVGESKKILEIPLVDLFYFACYLLCYLASGYLSHSTAGRRSVREDSRRTPQDLQLPPALLRGQGGVAEPDHQGGAEPERPLQESIPSCFVSGVLECADHKQEGSSNNLLGRSNFL